MVRLLIKTYDLHHPELPVNNPANDAKTIIEKEIDFDGTYSHGIVTKKTGEDGSVSWKPLFWMHDWEIIREVTPEKPTPSLLTAGPDMKKNYLSDLFTREDIEQLQQRVHKITGDGEVMQEFNKLLGINAG